MRSDHPLAPPTVPAVLTALGGMVLLGLCAAAGSVRVASIIPGTFITVASLLGAIALSTPALLAVHQFLGLSAKPEATVAALGCGLVHGGRVAAGLAPACLFFAATTQLWVLLLAIGLAVPGIVTAAVAVNALRKAEGEPTVRFNALLVGWTILTALISIRISVDLVDLTFEGIIV